MRYASLLGLALLAAAGVVGCGGSLGGNPSGGGGTGGLTGQGEAGVSPEIADYTWGDVTVHVAPTSELPGGLFVMEVTHPADPPGTSTTRSFGTASRLNPSNNGAYIGAGYTCRSPGLYEIVLYSCANHHRSETVAAASGCLAVAISQAGVMGEYLDLDGVHCQITSGTATINLPPPVWAPEASALPTSAANGWFGLQCTRTDGVELILGSKFVLPVQNWTLLC